MNVDCQWVEKHLEALFGERLGEEEGRLARMHIENCASCRKDAEALNAIDPLIKNYFRGELKIAQRPRVVHGARVLGLTGAGAAVVTALLVLLVRIPTTNPVVPPTPTLPDASPVVSVDEQQRPPKTDETGEQVRSKPTPGSAAPVDRFPPVPPTIGQNAPEFLVTDPAGYSHTLDEYRGHVVVIGVWNHNQAESISNIERLYKAYGANPKIRFVAVATERLPKPPKTTFPVVYNQGSKLFDAQPGDFVLVDENGSVEMRGSMVRDLDNLTRVLQGK